MASMLAAEMAEEPAVQLAAELAAVRWNYRSIFIFSNVLVSCVHMWGILIYSRTNLSMGIPDDVFALTTAAMFSA